MTTQTSTTPSVERSVLIDRLDGLLLQGSNPSDLQERLDAILAELVVGVSRCPLSGIPDDSQVQDAMEKAI